jgi:hypothetical protein
VTICRWRLYTVSIDLDKIAQGRDHALPAVLDRAIRASAAHLIVGRTLTVPMAW